MEKKFIRSRQKQKLYLSIVFPILFYFTKIFTLFKLTTRYFKITISSCEGYLQISRIFEIFLPRLLILANHSFMHPKYSNFSEFRNNENFTTKFRHQNLVHVASREFHTAVPSLISISHVACFIARLSSTQTADKSASEPEV